MKTNWMTVAEAKQVLGAEVPKHLIGENWENGKFVCEIVIRAQLAKHISDESAKKAAREDGRAARESSNASFLARPKLRTFNNREEQE